MTNCDNKICIRNYKKSIFRMPDFTNEQIIDLIEFFLCFSDNGESSFNIPINNYGWTFDSSNISGYKSLENKLCNNEMEIKFCKSKKLEKSLS